jgi:hypothetical protein
VTSPDLRVIACNLTKPTATAATGALAYVRWANPGHDNDRLPLLIRSRGGRWIRKWEDMRRLGNFRLKTVPPEHPMYARFRDEVALTHGTPEREEEALGRLLASASRAAERTPQ